MNFVFLITMYKEYDVVNYSVQNIRKSFPNALIYVVQSNKDSKKVIENVDKFDALSDLSLSYRHHKLAAHAISRNYSHLFTKAIENGCADKVIVAITGDTLITDPTVALKLNNELKRQNKILACSQAIGQNFHAVDSDPENGRCGGRYQFDGISDFMPQFFVLDGRFVAENRAFSTIAVINEFTSEQCLGDEFMKYVKGSFKDNALIIAKNAYDFSDGVLYNQLKI